MANRRSRHEGALALLAHHQALAGEFVDCLAHRDAADREALHQSVLGLEPRERLISPIGDLVFQPTGDLLIKRDVAVASERQFHRAAFGLAAAAHLVLSSGLEASRMAP